VAHHIASVIYALVVCMDQRLQGRNAEKIAAAFDLKPGQFEGLTYPDPSLWLAQPHEPAHSDLFWWIIDNVSVNFHHVRGVIFVGHASCGGCALKRGKMEFDQEKAAIIYDLQRTAQLIHERYPELEIKLGFVTIHDDQLIPGTELPEIDCEEIEVEALVAA